ncbi:hypothetical protein LguiA_034101 [Lonicera macranthoides]
MPNTFRCTCSSCAACTYKRKRCQPWYILQNIPEHQYLKTLNSFLFEATTRIENPTKGCTALLASLEQKVEGLQARAENNAPDVIPSAVNLSEPVPGSFLRLLMSEEGVQDILSTNTNLIENGALLTEADLPSFSNRSYDHATLDAVYQAASDDFLSQSSLDDFVTNFAKTTSPDWTALEDIRHDFSDYSSSDLSTILNFDDDDLRILQPFL